MAKVTILPEAEYTISNVAKTQLKSFPGKDGQIEFKATDVQFEGHEDLWIEVNTGKNKDGAYGELPKVGDKLTGHIEQDDQGRYSPVFKKARQGGGSWGGGRGESFGPGAQWANAYQTGAAIAAGYTMQSGKPITNISEYLELVDYCAEQVRSKIDTKAGTAAEAQKAADVATPLAADQFPADNASNTTAAAAANPAAPIQTGAQPANNTSSLKNW